MSDLHLHAVVHEGNGPWCLLVHGALGSRSYWRDNVAALGAVCRPVVIELWGHGRSPSPAEPARYEPEAYVEEFEHLREQLGAEQWVTVGQSMGASLTLRYGLAHPERVIGQVITNTSSALTDGESWRERHTTVVTPVAERIEAEGTGLLRDHWINPGRSKRIAEETRAAMAREFDEHSAPGIAGSLRYTNRSLPLGDRLAEVSRPTLLTLGVEEERFLPLVPVAYRIPGLDVVELPAAHAVNAQDPDGWNAAVAQFITRLVS